MLLLIILYILQIIIGNMLKTFTEELQIAVYIAA